jgi:hypothetical protein
MLESWEKSINSGENEIEVSQQYDIMNGDIIERTTFGSSYDEGKHIFNMRCEKMRISVEAFKKDNLSFYR